MHRPFRITATVELTLLATTAEAAVAAMTRDGLLPYAAHNFLDLKIEQLPNPEPPKTQPVPDISTASTRKVKSR